MVFELVSEIEAIEIIAVDKSIRDRERLRKIYGKARWRKLKGMAQVRLDDGTVTWAEIHWYEAHGIGRKEMKIKRIVDL